MIDFIQSPLQFVRPMTDTEWQDLKLRQAQREARKRQRTSRRPAGQEPRSSQPATEAPVVRNTATRAMIFTEVRTTAN